MVFGGTFAPFFKKNCWPQEKNLKRRKCETKKVWSKKFSKIPPKSSTKTEKFHQENKNTTRDHTSLKIYIDLKNIYIN